MRSWLLPAVVVLALVAGVTVGASWATAAAAALALAAWAAAWSRDGSPGARLFRAAYALPVALLIASAVLTASLPSCGYAGAPACVQSWRADWADYTLLLGVFFGVAVAVVHLMVLAGATLRRSGRSSA